MKTLLRSIRRHHRERLIRQVAGYSDWYREHALKVYNNRKFCSCTCHNCGNPRRVLRGRTWLTRQEQRQVQQAQAEQSVG